MRKIFLLIIALAFLVASSAYATETKPSSASKPANKPMTTKSVSHKSEKSKKQLAKTVKPEPKKQTAEKAPAVKKETTAAKETDTVKEKPKTVAAPPAVINGDIVTTLAGRNDLKTMSNLLQAAGLADSLKTAGPYTILAPTDAAFAKLPEGTLLEWLKPRNKSALRSVIGYHLVPGKLALSDFTGKQVTQNTIQGGAINIDGNHSDYVLANKAKINKAEIPTANGVIFILDGVLEPESISISTPTPSSSGIM